MSKPVILILSLMVILTAAFLTYIRNATPYAYKPGTWPEADRAVSQANYLYQVAKDRGTDFSSGPCLSNAVADGWVVDIVHSPRTGVDNLAENECPAYLHGQASHYVELDIKGNLIRVK